MPFRMKLRILFSFRVKLIIAFLAVIVIAVFISLHDDEDKNPGIGPSELILSTTESETTEAEPEEETTSIEDNFDTYIILADDKTTINGDGATFENGKVNITKQGVYAIKGSLANGSINIKDDIFVKLLFMGASVHCENESAISIEGVTQNTEIYLAEGTVNSFSGLTQKGAVICSSGEIDISGKGNLIIRASSGAGIFSENEVCISDATVSIISTDEGIFGTTGVDISSATVNVTSAADGIKSTSIYGPLSGEISIRKSNLEVYSVLDGIQSAGSVSIEGGKLEISTSGSKSEHFINGGEHSFYSEKEESMISLEVNNSSAYDTEEDFDEKPSAKGIKAQEDILINEAGVKITAKDDAIHGNVVKIQSGYLSIESTDDGIHGDEEVKINGGDIDITGSYEGIESETVSLNGGTILIKAINDGISASSDEDEDSCAIEIDGAYVHVDAEGDGVESGGDAVVLDGTLIVFGPSNSENSALDCDGKFYIVSGTVLTLSDRNNTQPIKSDGVPVLSYTFSEKVSGTGAIVKNDGESIIGYHTSKSYDHVVFASEELDENKNYSVYLGGSFDEDSMNGIYAGGYKTGTFAGRMK